MTLKKVTPVFLLIGALIFGHQAGAYCQELSPILEESILQGFSIEKLGILDIPGTGARPFAMGGAYTAVSDDAFALLFNPAGLAQIRRKEISFGIHHGNRKITNNYIDLLAERSSSNTSLGSITAVYPYPTYRGSLVIGFGVFRAGTSDLEYTKNARLEQLEADVDNLLIQSGTIYQYHIGAGFDLSPRIALGGGIVIWDESMDVTEEIVHSDPGSTAVVVDNVSMDLDGFSINLGILLRLNEHLRTGVTITSPTWLSYKGDGITEYNIYYSDGDVLPFEPENALIDEDYRLPMKFRGGLALNLSHLLLAADASYADYSQTKWNGKALLDESGAGGDHIFKGRWSFNVGVEAAVPGHPVRIRGGYSYIPIVLGSVEEIAYIKDDKIWSVPYESDVLKDRQFFTFGIGGLIDKVLAIDLAVALGGFERDTGLLNEKRDVIEFILTSAYRF